MCGCTPITAKGHRARNRKQMVSHGIWNAGQLLHWNQFWRGFGINCGRSHTFRPPILRAGVWVRMVSLQRCLIVSHRQLDTPRVGAGLGVWLLYIKAEGDWNNDRHTYRCYLDKYVSPVSDTYGRTRSQEKPECTNEMIARCDSRGQGKAERPGQCPM